MSERGFQIGFWSNNTRSSRLYTSIISIVAVALLVGAGFIGYQVKVQLDKEIYGTPRGEIENETPKNYDLPYEKVTYNSDADKEIVGWFVPSKSATECIILSPGKGSTKWNVLKYVPFLHKEGYNVFLYDARGRGESEGERWGFGYFQSRDIIHGVDFLSGEYGLEEFGVLGRSAGATASLLAAGDHPKIDAVVSDSGFASIKMASMSYGGYQNNPLFQAVFPLYTFGAKLSLGVDVNSRTNLKKHVNDGEYAAFFIHGTEDEVILPQNSEVLFDKKTGDKRIWLPEGVGHVEAYDVYPDEYASKVSDFFAEHLGGEGEPT